MGFHYTIAGYDIYPGEILLSAAALLIVAVLFILKIKMLKTVQTILAVILFSGVMVLFIAGLPTIIRSDTNISFGESGFTSKLTGIMTIVLIAPWAFVGFDTASLETAHFHFPVKKSRAIIPISIIMGGLVYIALSCFSAAVVPAGYGSWVDYMGALDGLKGAEAVPGFFAARSILGNAGVIIITITALAAILTGIIGACRASARMLATMAENKIVSGKFLNIKYSIVFIMLISIAISFMGRNALEWFIELTSFGAIIGYAYTSAAAAKLAGEEGNHKVVITGRFPQDHVQSDKQCL